jgi:hypothetical protein
MHQTLAVRNYSWWYETDPFARPFAKLPAPAYYATGLAMATGLNWLSWKWAIREDGGNYLQYRRY